MSIKASDYEAIDKGVKLHKSDFTKALFDITWRENGQQKRKRKTVNMAKRSGWGRRDYIKEAKRLFLEYEDGQSSGVDENITVAGLYEAYSATMPDTRWKKEQSYTFRKHIEPNIGKKKIVNINRSNIDAIIKSMRDEGAKPRTQKLILNILSPMFKYAIQNGIVKDDPTKFITIKLPKTKKPVVDATGTFRKLWSAISDLYSNDHYYFALFKFLIIHGRRKSEVLKMRWENIDMKNMLYTIEATKSGEDQTYALPDIIADDLRKIPRGQSGYVFESPLTGTHLHHFRGQVDKVREKSGVKEFTPHYARNVLVSMLAEQGVNAIFLSGTLGHTDANTINKYLSMPRKEASRATGEIIDTIVKQV